MDWPNADEEVDPSFVECDDDPESAISVGTSDPEAGELEPRSSPAEVVPGIDSVG
jgi:hypothetical protein